MANERQWDAVPPVLLTANGTTEGVLQVVDTAGFFVGMQATLLNNAALQLTVYIKRVVNSTTLWVGANKGGMDHNVDVSAFTVATASNISAGMQNKSTVPMEARMLATYATDPVDAWRVQSVDSYGDPYTDSNPLPVAFDGTVSIGDVHILGPAPANNELNVNPDGSINVVIEPESITIGTVLQGTVPWIDNVAQFGGNAVVTGTGVSGLGIPRVTVSSDSNILSTQSGIWNINNITGTISLPTGAATSALQTTGNSILTSILANQTNGTQTTQVTNFPSVQPISGTVTALQGTSPWIVSGTTTISGPVAVTQDTTPWVDNITQFGSNPVVTGTGGSGVGIPRVTVSNDSNILATQSGIWNINNITGTVSLPTGAATSALQTSGNTSLSSILANQTNGTQATQVTNFPSVQPISGTVTALQGTSPWVVSGTTTISGPVSVTQGTTPWVDNITQFGSNPVVTGTGSSGLGIPRVTVSNDSNILATQSGTWNINNISGTVSLPTGASTSALQTTANTTLSSILANQTNGTQTTQVTNFPAVQPISGTVTADQGGAPWTIAGSAVSVSGSIASNGNILQLPNGSAPNLGLFNGITLEISGTWSSTLTLIGSNGGAYYTIDVVNLSTPNAGPQSTITSNGMYYAPIEYVDLELVSSSYVSGTVLCYASLRAISSPLIHPTLIAANLTEVGGAAISLGQTVPASSIPVVTQPDNQPSTQNVTIVDSASTTTAYANNQNFITGTPTTGSAASFTLSSYESIEILVTGTWTGTLQTEVSMDNGTTWFTRGVKQTGAAYIGSSYTANFEGGMNFGGMTNVRVRAVAAMTGTAIVRVNASINPASLIISNPLTLRDSTIQSVSNTIKASGVASTASDTALVVALSPNSSLPTGTNTLGNTNTMNDHQGSGSISTGTGSIIATTNGCSTVTFTVQGTWSTAAMLVEGSVDSGASWTIIPFSVPNGNQTSTFTSNNTYIVPCGGYNEVRLVPYLNIWTSGTLTATWDASVGVNVSSIISAAENPISSSSSVITRVANSATSVSLLAANSGRKAAYFYNDSSQIAYVVLSATAASTTAYTLQMAPLSFAAIDLDPVWTGAVQCIWAASGTGGMQVTELS